MAEKEATATEVHNFETEEVPMRDQEKQGGKCCGGCCDYRRAVIVLCIISLALSVIGLFANAAPNFDRSTYPKLDEIVKDHATNILIVRIVGIVMTLIALVGAVSFNFIMVALYVFWSVLELIVGIILEKGMVDDLLECVGDNTCMNDGTTSVEVTDQQIKDLETIFNTAIMVTYAIAAVFTVLWVYPSVFLAVEIKKGIMTKTTYPREEMSCCCVKK